MTFAAGCSAEEPSEVQTLFSGAWELQHQHAINRITITRYSALPVFLGRTQGSHGELGSGSSVSFGNLKKPWFPHLQNRMNYLCLPPRVVMRLASLKHRGL